MLKKDSFSSGLGYFSKKNNCTIFPMMELKSQFKVKGSGQFLYYCQNTGDLQWIKNRDELWAKNLEIYNQNWQLLGDFKENNDFDLEFRKDLSALPFVTIDGADAKDFDDAVWVEEKKNFFKVKVAIADVSCFLLGKEKFLKRVADQGCSTYLPGKAFPMLPKSLTEDLCSLVPNKNRPAMVAEIKLSKDGMVLECKLCRAIICSKARLTYDNCFSKEEKLLAPARKLAKLLRKKRFKQGALNFAFEQFSYSVSSKLRSVKIDTLEMSESRHLIEEFMILANVEVAKIAAKKKHPVLYRCHMEPPAREINFLDKNRKKLHPRGFKVTAGTLHHWLNWLTDQGLNQPFHLNILSAMEPAFYTASNVGHFGLGEGLYLHFTSPIRRFPDLWNHIVLKALFFKDFRYNNLMESLKIFEAAEKSNFAEKRSVICEIVSHKLLNYSYLEKYGNDIFLGNFAYKKQKDLFFYVQGLPLILSAKKRGPFPYLGEPRELTNLRLSSEGFIRAELLD